MKPFEANQTAVMAMSMGTCTVDIQRQRRCVPAQIINPRQASISSIGITLSFHLLMGEYRGREGRAHDG